jgi:hypothetical protein
VIISHHRQYPIEFINDFLVGSINIVSNINDVLPKSIAVISRIMDFLKPLQWQSGLVLFRLLVHLLADEIYLQICTPEFVGA